MAAIALEPSRPVSELVLVSRTAKRYGFESVYLTDDSSNRDPIVVLSEIASRTSGLDIGVSVLNPYELHPVRLAAQMATIAEIGEVDISVGLGAGDVRRLDRLGIEQDKPVERTLETATIIRKLYSGESVDHDGTYSLDNASICNAPNEYTVVIGGDGPHMIGMASKHADTVLLNSSHPDIVSDKLRHVDTGLDQRPASKPDPTIGTYAPVSISRDAESARERAREITTIFIDSVPNPVLDDHGIDTSTAREISELLEREERQRAIEAISDQMIDTFCIAGSPSEVGERIDRLFQLVDTVVFGSPLGPNPRYSIEYLSRWS